MIELLRPWALLLLPLPVLARWLLPALAARAALPVPAAVHELLSALSRSQDARLMGWPASLWLRTIGWVALVAALAGPQTRAGTLLKPTGRDLIVAIDLSASMGQKDMVVDGEEVSRLGVVYDLISEFINKRAGDRVGLIAFSQEAFLIAPLTFDIRAVEGLLDELGIGLPGHRTDLGRAVGLTIQTFRKEPPATRVLIVISDGEDNTGALAVDDAVGLATQHDIRIHTIGFSSDIKPDGAAVLRQMAKVTGGEYFVAQSPQALAEISGEIDRIEPSAIDRSQDAVMRSWSWVALTIALTALAALTWQEIREA
ncbi:MAG: hypothetical protein ETSY1_17480 [Candidatus Entotheonella factor]|uniref:VWFA domain-containing protein n=1 Tax=Entotheonella factor TaxID=1429438 RepID=W4LLL4_ENTF1|nr:MAG: hypothetical protein ETSY1_17480 [Candidatus Entotheonella factor]